MNTKNRIIEGLLRVAKKHKVLTYPVLALVAIVSVISNLFSWGKGAGKRVVAVIMVMVMLVSQSYFLTSSANDDVDTTESVTEQQELSESAEEEQENSTPATEAPKETVKEAVTETTTEVASDNGTSTTEDTVSEDSANAGSQDTQLTEGDTTEQNGDNTYGTSEEENDEIKEDEIDSKEAGAEIAVSFRLNADLGDGYSGQNGTVASGTYKEDDNGNNTGDTRIVKNSDGTYNVAGLVANANEQAESSGNTKDGQFSFDCWYQVDNPTVKLTDFTHITAYDNKITLFAKRKIAVYKFNIVNSSTNASNTMTSTPIYNVSVGTASGDGYYRIPVDSSSVDSDTLRSQTVTINGLACTGYSFSNASPQSGTADKTSNNSVNIVFTGNSTPLSLNLTWTPDTYTVVFHDNNGGVIKEEKYTYDDSKVMIPYPDSAAKPVGRSFSKWHIGDDETNTVANQAAANTCQSQFYAVSGFSESKTVDLYPDFDDDNIITIYNGVKYDADGVTGSGPKIEPAAFTFDGGTQTSGEISVMYASEKAPVSGEFIYNLDVSNQTELENTYGVSVNTTATGIQLKTDKPKDITKHAGTTDGKFILNITATETTASKSGDKRSYHFSVAVNILPKKISIDQSKVKNTSKIYDGNTSLKQEFIDSYVGIGKGLPVVGYDDIKAVITGPVYDEKNAGERAIKFESITPVTSGELNDVPDGCYELEELTISGEIKKKSIDVKTYAELNEYDKNKNDGYVRYGEVNNVINPYPVLKYELLDEEDLCGDDTIDDEDVTLEAKQSEIDGDIVTYSIKATLNDQSNYKFSNTEQGEYKVKQDSPDSRYKINPPSVNGWIQAESATIDVVPGKGYDTVVIEGREDSQGVITQADSGKPITFHLFDSSTGAVTSSETITVNLDGIGPKCIGYKIVDINYNSSADGTGKYIFSDPDADDKAKLLIGSVLDFGTYISKTMTLQVMFEDPQPDDADGVSVSGVTKVQYSVFDSGSYKEAELNYIGGITTATFTISNVDLGALKNTAGVINIIATDYAGNSSKFNLSPTDKDDYLWSVEEDGPHDVNLTMKALSGDDTIDVVTDSIRFYSNCTAYLTGRDDVAGIERVTWYVNDEAVKSDVDYYHENRATSVKSNSSLTLSDYTDPTRADYKVYAVVTDNAGNYTDSNIINVNIDNDKPIISTAEFDKRKKEGKWSNTTQIDFETWDTLSGIKSMEVKDSSNNPVHYVIDEEVDETHWKGYFNAVANNTTYKIIVTDWAGNEETKILEVDRISNTVPDCPVITFSPAEANGNNGWYNMNSEMPKAIITAVTETSDGTGVNNTYSVREASQTDPLYPAAFSGTEFTYTFPKDGIYYVNAKSVSYSDVECGTDNNTPDKHAEHTNVEIKIDRTEPTFSNFSITQGSGTSVVIHYTIKDALSGVDKDSIQVLKGEDIASDVNLTTSEVADGYDVSFEITTKSNYKLRALDNAGNEHIEDAITPMSWKVKAVSSITSKSAIVGATVYKGSFPINSGTISYRKLSDTEYTEVQSVSPNANGSDSITEVPISAVISDLAPATSYVYKIVATSTGNEVLEFEGFFRTLSEDGSGIDVSGQVSYSDPDKEGSVVIGIYEGNQCVNAQEVTVNAGKAAYFTLENVEDGTYSIIATDGIYSKSTKLKVTDGTIEYPDELTLVLSGKNTAVEILTDDTPDVTVDNLDMLFDLDDLFDEEDENLIEYESGTVEFKLLASVTSLSESDLKALGDAGKMTKKRLAIIDFTVKKYQYDSDGDMLSEKYVHDIPNGKELSVTIPLGKYASYTDLEVVRIHGSGAQTLSDVDSDPSTYTIRSSQFSTYVLMGTAPQSTTSTEKTNNGSSSVVVDPVTVDPDVVVEPSIDTSPYTTTATTEDEEDIREIKDSSSKPKSSGSHSSVGSLTSSGGSAKTGDETPIAVMLGLMMISMAGVVVLRKKSKLID